MSDFTITIGRPVPLDREQRRDRARRAHEVLDGAGWLFDEFMSTKNRNMLDIDTSTTDGQAQLFRAHADIRIAAELKAHLIHIVETQQAEDTIHERHQRGE